MSAINKNIKKIRTVKKISQQAFADLFGVTRASIGSYEEGRAEPKIGLVMDVANKFGISVEDLLNKELTINDISGFSKHEVGLQTHKKLNPDGERHLIPFVSAKNCSTYLNNLDSQEYLQYMPRFEIPNFEYEKARAFEVVGNDMWHMNHGLYPGDTLVCTYKNVKRTELLKELAVHVFVFEGQILIRRLVFGNGKLILRAINPFYPDLMVDVNEVTELWEAHTLIGRSAHTLRIPGEQQVDLQSRVIELETKLNDLLNSKKQES